MNFIFNLIFAIYLLFCIFKLLRELEKIACQSNFAEKAQDEVSSWARLWLIWNWFSIFQIAM